VTLQSDNEKVNQECMDLRFAVDAANGERDRERQERLYAEREVGKAAMQIRALEVDKAGLLYIDLDKTPLDRDTVSARVAEAHKADPKRAILVKGDKSLAYGEVRKVVDLLRKAGLEGVALAVEKPAGEGP
jgi:biopolymer transport protein ExbD